MVILVFWKTMWTRVWSKIQPTVTTYSWITITAKNAEWKKYTPPAGFPGFYYRVPRLENRSVSSTLEGEIHIDMNGYHLAFFGDTLRYEIYALDRAKNITNIVVTPTIIAD